MARSNVPKFGNWENEDSVPYTVYFDKARKKKTGGPMINPNDPPNIDPKPKTRAEEPMGKAAPVRPTTPEHRDGDFRQFSNSSGRSNNESGSGGRGQRPARVARPRAGSEHGSERSPLHPRFQQKVVGRGGGSQASEGRNYENSQGTPVRSRIRPARGDESPDKGATVPKFGAWNENDSQDAENFTHIFKRVRDERNTAMANPTATPKRASYDTHSQLSDEPKDVVSHGGRSIYVSFNC
ncbi:hypothetical protein CASFOL_040261 [Castilleja foliolosa]|uniref:RIN4 pathogenic type III effector avirulence factor Avr cleavage site domain-containing protein n=1 Tax=Castilleja foliolosa TaxID=1961234 RepID=A0ABD3BFB3_9LAMI